jgi:hypothetical protein
MDSGGCLCDLRRHHRTFNAQTPLLTITLDYCGGSFAPVNIALLTAGLPLLVLPWYLDRYLKRPADARQNPKHETELALRQPLSPEDELIVTARPGRTASAENAVSSSNSTRRRMTSADEKKHQYAHGEFEELTEGDENDK